jgi:hypothetical protein
VTAAVLALVLLISSAGGAAALPTAEFAFGPTNPEVAQAVAFTFNGTCDVPPCRIQWRWFKTGGSSLGTVMGEGPNLTYAFPAVGRYSVVAKITNSTRTHAFASVTHAVSVRSTFQDDRRAVGYDSWRGVSAAEATGGGYHLSSGSKAIASKAFFGSQVTYVARTGPDRGIANVAVDGVSRGSTDLYAAVAGARTLSVAGLTAATHRIVVRPTGAKNLASTGTAVSLDEFVVGTAHFDDTHVSVVYDTWSGAASGTVHTSAATGAITTLTFTGSSVTWLTATGPDQGRAAIAIDGTTIATVDNYAAVRAGKVPRTFASLFSGTHTVRVTVLGSRNTLSTANRITSDAFIAQ